MIRGINILAQTPLSESIPPVEGDRYWVGGSGDWLDATNHWSNESGGTPGAEFLPTESTDVYFDENSGLEESGDVTLSVDEEEETYPTCKNIVCETGGSFSFTVNTMPYIFVCGNTTLESGLIFVGAGLYLSGTGSYNITTNNSNPGTIYIGSGGSYTLQDNLTLAEEGELLIYNGSFDANDFDITADTFDFQNVGGNVVVTMGSGTWEARDETTAVYVVENDPYTVTINAETSTVKLTGSGGSDFNGGGKTYYNLWLANGDVSENYYAISGSNIFNDITIVPGAKIVLPDGDDQVETVTTFNAVGEDGNLIEISGTGDLGWTLSCASGTIVCDYLNLSYCRAGGGATFYAGANSVDGGHNSGWIFTAPP